MTDADLVTYNAKLGDIVVAITYPKTLPLRVVLRQLIPALDAVAAHHISPTVEQMAAGH